MSSQQTVNITVQPTQKIELVVQPPQTAAINLRVGQGPAGPQGVTGADGLNGQGIDNFSADPLAIYILTKS